MLRPSLGNEVRPGAAGRRLMAVATALVLALYAPAAAFAEAGLAARQGGAPTIVRGSLADAPRFDKRDRTTAGPSAPSTSPAYVDGEVLVRFTALKATKASRATAHDAAGAASSEPLAGVPGLERVKLAKGVSVEQAVAAYGRQPGVTYAQPNFIRTLMSATYPNDPRFSAQWGFDNTGQTGGTTDKDIDAPEAWGAETGSPGTIVAVIDSGVDYDHPDLDGNMWVNAAESAGVAGVDDDHNGYIDDLHGIDAVNDDSDPMDDIGHGTHVAGTIGAEGDNALGVAGVCWDVSIMAIKVFNPTTNDATLIEGIEYATMMGADVVNCSWGGGGGYDGDALYDAIAASPALFVCSAGNNAANTDHTPSYPSCYDLDNIISVAASDHKDALASFSNYGAANVDVAAPGVDIMSTVPGGVESRIVLEDFSSGTPWTTSAAVAPWTLATDRYTSPSKSAANKWYADDEESWLAYDSALDLSSATACELRFDYWMDLEENCDYLRVLASTDGVDYSYVGSDTGYTGTWQEGVVDLSDYAGKPVVYVAFILESDSSLSGSDGYEGVYIDDFSVWTTGTSVDYSSAYSDEYSGTSMAAPHVTGVAALLKSADPTRDAAALKSSILDSAQYVPGLFGKVKTSSRLNAYRALTGAVDLQTSITIRTNATTTYIGRTPILSGSVSPSGMIGRNIVVYVMKPGKTYWTYSSNRTAYSLNGSAAWQYKYYFRPGMTKGYYKFKSMSPAPGFASSEGFRPAFSPTIVSIRLK